MTIVDFLSELRLADIRLSLNNGKLKVSAPAGALTGEIKAQLKARKQEILDFLAAVDSSSVISSGADPQDPSSILSFLKSAALISAKLTADEADKTGLFPLSFAQENLWFLYQMNPLSTAYNMPITVRLRGQLDLAVFERVIEEVIRRHENLRTTFAETDDGEVYPVIHESTSWKLEVDDSVFSSLGSDDLSDQCIDQFINECIEQEVQRPFSLEKGPLFRLRLIPLHSKKTEDPQDECDYLMLAGMHHIVSDGWSINVLMAEIGALYVAYLQHQPSPFADLPIQYSHYAQWQRQRLQGELLEGQLGYWTKLLDGAPSHIGLPTDRPRPAVQTDNGARLPIEFSTALSARLDRFSQDQGLTLFMTLMAGYQILLSRYGGEEDLCVGIPVAGRRQQETEGLIGFFVNALITRTDLSGNPSVRDYLARVKGLVLDVFSHDEVPMNTVLDALKVERNLSYSPLVQVGFQMQRFDASANETDMQNQMMAELKRLTNLEMEWVTAKKMPSKFDLILSLNQTKTEQGDQLTGYLDYNTDLYDEETVVAMMQQYHHLLEAITQDLDCPIHHLPLVSKDRLYALLGVDCNQETILPVTANQRGLIVDSLLHPDTLQNSLGYYTDIFQEVDQDIFAKAVQGVTDQHGLLRTRFLSCDLPYLDDVVQIVAAEKKTKFTFTDLRHESVTPQDYIDSVIYKPYDILSDDLLAIELVQFDEAHFVVICAAHHALLDGVSLYAHLDAVIEAYLGDQIKTEDSIEGQFESHSFENYLAIDNKIMDTQRVVDYWIAKFSTVDPLTIPFPLESSSLEPSPLDQKTTGSEVRELLTIDPLHVKAMREYCEGVGISVSLYLKALYSILVKTYCATESDFHLYEYFGGRPPGHEKSLGCYYQQTPFIVSAVLFEQDALLSDLFDYSRQMQRESRDKRTLSISKQRQIAPKGPVTFLYNFYHFDTDIRFSQGEEMSGQINDGQLKGELLKAEIGSPKVESAVQLIVKDLHGQLRIDLRYDARVFSSFDFAARLISLSHQLVKNETGENQLGRIDELDFLLPKEKLFLANTVFQNSALPPVTSVQQLFEQQVEKTPDAIAVTCAEQSLNYQELNQQANQLAHYLRAQGIEANSRVGICVEPSLDMIVSVLAVLKAGGVYVPLDTRYPIERLSYLIDDSDVMLVITQSGLVSRLNNSKVKVFVTDSEEQGLIDFSLGNPNNRTRLDDLLYIIYTSGSTGLPKGAGVTHRGEVNLLTWFTREFDVSATDKTLLMSAFGFDLTQKNLFAVLIKGGCLVIPELDYYDPDLLTEHIERDGITLLNCAPSAFYPLLEEGDSCLNRFSNLSSLRILFLGGEPIRIEMLSHWLSAEDCICEVVNTYGPTECTDVVAYHRIDPSSGEGAPMGKPIDNTQLYVVDSTLATIKPVPLGLVGELCVAGIGVGVGYLSKDEKVGKQLTESVFIENPFGEGRLYRTGDLVRYRENGDLEYIRRKDFQVKIRGMRIELGEIEVALRQLGGVKDSLVILASVENQLLAYVVCDSTFDRESWREALRNHLPNHMIPNALISVDTWPLTPNGKVDRTALLNLVASSDADLYVAPRSEIELQLVSIWSSVLKVDKIGVYDNFFDLGGHSLLATQIAARARKAFNIPLQLRDLLGQPTIDAIAKQVAKLMKGDSSLSLAPVIERADRSQRLPLSFAQQRLWLLDQLEPGSVVYNMPLTVRVRGNLNVELLRQSFAEVVRRHESLRTLFILGEGVLGGSVVGDDEDLGTVYQQIADPAKRGASDWALPVTSVALESLGNTISAQEIEVKRLVAIEIMTPFDLETGPLFRTSLFKLDENDYVFVAVTHHIVSDGWSMGLMIQEVASIYASLSLGYADEYEDLQSNELLLHKEAPLQYADFAQWQRNWLQGEVLQHELDYWSEQLKDLEYLKFPTDYPRPPIQTYQGASYPFSLTPQLSKRLQLLGHRQGATLFMTLLAAFKVLLFRYCGQNDICVGTPTANRQQEELESIIGFFINTLALRTQVEGESSFVEILSSVQQNTMAAFDHQDVPFERIVEEVTTQRDMSRSPLFQIMFVMQNTLPLDQQVIHGADLVFEPITPDIESAKFDITLTMSEEESLSGVFQYNTDLFTQSRISDFALDFERLLTAVVDQPESKVSSLPLASQITSPSELNGQQAIPDWNTESSATTELASSSSMGYEPPRNGVEESILVIWTKVLSSKVLSSKERVATQHQNQIGIHDNFFELGGHSLLATQVISRIKRQFKIEVPLRVLFEAPTVAQLAQQVETLQQSGPQITVPRIQKVYRENSPIAVSFGQQRLWFLDQLSPGSFGFNMPFALHIKGCLDHHVLQKTFAEVARRHEVLRSRFESKEGEPVVVIKATTEWDLSLLPVELPDTMTASQREEKYKALAGEEAKKPFNLERDSLLRTTLCQFDDDDFLLLITMHHMVSDGWSINLFIREVAVIYAHYSEDKPSPLPELRLQYSDYAGWQRQWLEGEVLQQQLDYWLGQLKGAPEILSLPTDKPRPPIQTTSGASVTRELPKGLYQDLLSFSASHNATLFMSLLAAYQILLSRYAKVNDVVVGIPIAGRHHGETENIIGLFLNGLVLRTRLQGNPTVTDFLRRVKDVTLGAFAHQDLPAEILFDALEVERNPQYPTGAQVGFQLQNMNTASTDIDVDVLAKGLLGVLPQLDIEFLGVDRVVSKYDISFIVEEVNGTALVTAEYNTDLFVEVTIVQMLQQYQHVLEKMIEAPETGIDLITLVDHHQLSHFLQLGCLKVEGEVKDEFKQVLPLTAMQQGMVLASIVHPDTLQNSLGYAAFIHQAMDIQVWHEAIQEVVASHAALRTQIVETSQPFLDTAYQVILPRHKISLEIIDWSHRSVSSEEINQKINHYIYQPYDILSSPLVKSAVLKISDNEYVMLVAAHHVVLDGVAVVSFGVEVLRTYERLINSGVSQEPNRTRPLSVTDLAAKAERDPFPESILKNIQQVDSAEIQSFWQAMIPPLEALDLPLSSDAPLTVIKHSHQLTFSEDHWAQVRGYCRQQKVTPAIYFKVLYGILLQRYCQPKSGFYINEMLAARGKGQMTTLGCFVQQVPYFFAQAQFEGSSQISDLYSAARAYQKKTKNKALLSMALQETMLPQGRLNFMYDFYHFAPTPDFMGGSVEVTALTNEIEGTVEFFPKMLEKTVQLNLHYQVGLFENFDFLERLESVSLQILNGAQTLDQLDLMKSSNERQHMLQTLRGPSYDFDLERCLHHCFEEQAIRSPHKVACVFDDVRLTYGELNAQANQLAHYLTAKGVTVNQLVGLWAQRSSTFLVGILGIMKAGGAYVPMDPAYPQERISHMMTDSKVSIVLTVERLLAEEHLKSPIDFIPLDKDWHQIALCNDTNPSVEISADHRAYMIYTSGSTGQPKGAIIHHRGALNHVLAECKSLTTPDVCFDEGFTFLQNAPASSDISVWQFLGPLVTGGKTVILDEVTDTAKMLRLIQAEEVQLVELVPVVLQLLVDHLKGLYSEGLNNTVWQLPSLQWMMATGEAVPVSVVNDWLALYKDIPIINAYGPTEASDDILQSVIREPLAMTAKSVPIGLPIGNVNILILDPYLNLTPQGIPGEICVYGVGVGEGYWQDDNKTAAAFLSLESVRCFGSSTKDRLYRTGDLGRCLQDGSIEYIGRIDNQVQIRGFRVELGEIEAALHQHSSVKENVVIVREDVVRENIEGSQTLAAYVVIKDSTALSELRLFLMQTLPDYMVPNSFTALDHLPLTPAGKIDRDNLPVPEMGVLVSTEYVAPRNKIERELCTIWEGLLQGGKVGSNVDSNIGSSDNFFELGGHSLLATQLISRIRGSFQVDLGVRAVFEEPTISGLALLIEFAQGRGDTLQSQPLIRFDNDEPVPLSYSQQRLWFMEQLNPGSAAFNMPGAFKLTGDLDLSVLETVLQAIVQRHDTLRTHFQSNEDGDAFMVVDGSSNDKWVLPLIDLREVATDALEQSINQELRANETTPFDLLNGPLFRLQVLVLPTEAGVAQHIILFCMHHIVSDGGSIAVLTQEIVRGYASCALTGEVSLPVLPIQYSDYVLWQHTHRDNQVIDRQLAYWKQYLEGCDSFLQLPTDFPRPAQQTTTGDRVRFEFPAGFESTLKKVCTELGVTPFMFMLTSYQLLLSLTAQQDDVLVGVPIAGRDHSELQGLIGFFINSVVIRGDMSDNKTVRSLIENTREGVLNAFSNHDVPAERVLQTIEFERDPAYPPLVQVAFQLFQTSTDNLSINQVSISDALANSSMSDFKFEALGLEKVESKLDMTLELHLSAGEMVAVLEYNTDLFSPTTINTFLQNYVSLSETMMASLDAPSRSLDWISQAQLIKALGLEASDEEVSGSEINVWPVTAMQRDLYLDSVMNPGDHRNSLGFVADLHTPIDRELLQQCLNRVAQSHSMLRAHFVEAPYSYMDFVYQVIPKHYEVSFEYEDWTAKDLSQLALDEAGVQRLAEDYVYRAHDVKHSEHLSRYKLIALSDQRSLLLVTAHHAMTDGVALVQHAKEVVSLYESLSNSKGADSKAVEVEKGSELESQTVDNYYDHIVEDRQSMDTAETLDFWRTMLSDAESLSFRLGSYREKSKNARVDNKSTSPVALTEARGSKVSKQLPLDDALWQGIKKYCRKSRITPAHFFKCVYGYLLNNYCAAEKDFPIMELALGRSKENANSQGCYYQQVPFMMRQQSLKSDMTMQTVFADARAYQKEIKNHRHISVLAQNTILPAGPITFLYNFNAYFEEIVFDGEAHNNIGLPPDVDNQVLLSIKLADDQLYLIMHYYDHLFEDFDFLQRMEWISQQLLDGQEILGELKLVLPKEEENLVEQAMASTVEHEPYQPLIQQIEKQIEQQIKLSPDAIAVSCGDDNLSYADLHRRSSVLAASLQQQGAKPGTIVAVCLDQDCDLMVALLAVLKTGAAYLPLDPNHPKERLLFMAEDSSACIVLTKDAIQQEIGFSKAILFEGDDVLSDEFKTVYADANALFYVIYTSGSTGKPKASGVLQRGVFNLQQWYGKQFSFDATDQHLLISAIGFDLSQKNLWAPLLTGGTLHFVDAQEYDPRIIVETINRRHITRVNCAPSAFYPLLEDPLHYSTLSSLKTVILGGEPIRMADLKSWLESDDCQSQLVNSYGPTECTDIASYYLIPENVVPEPQQYYDKPVPLGGPNDNVQLWVVNQHQQLLPQGLVGELLIGGQGVGAGYLNSPELDDQAFINSPVTEERAYLTGDLVFWDREGLLQYVGRSDFQVKIRGQRIELGEIEYALRQLNGVKDSLVLLYSEKVNKDTLIAYVLSDDDALPQSDWRKVLRDYLPDTMLPSGLYVLQSWPLNANGKLDRHALPKEVASGYTQYVAPRTPIEKILADILKSVLRVEQVGIYDSFFDLGGHSLLATQVVARVRTLFKVELPLRKLFETPTVAGLAEIIEQSQRVEQLNLPPIVVVGRSERIPLSFAQQRLFVLQELDQKSVAYNMFAAVRVRGDLDLEVFANSFKRIIERHESLRTTFQVDENSGQVFQVIHNPSDYNREFLPLNVIDMRHLTRDQDVEAEVKGLVAMDAMTAFDLRTGPLMRATLYQIEDKDFVLVANMHHIISDGWSLGVLVKEIALLYFSQSNDAIGESSLLSPLPIQYPDFAHWQRAWLQGDVLEQQLSYWRTHLAGVPNLELPTDYARLPVQGAKGAHVSFTLSRDISEGIYQLGQQQGATPFITLLAVFNILLYRHSGQTDFAVGSPIANRTQEVLEPLIGVFVNTLCLRSPIEPTQTFEDYLAVVKSNTLTAYDHQDVPFESIVDALNVARDMSHTPLFQAMFMLQNTPLDHGDGQGEGLSEGLVQSGLQFEALKSEVELAKFDITLSLQEVDGQFSGQFAYREELFDKSSVQRFVDHFKTLLLELTVNPEFPINKDQKVSAIKMLSTTETEQQLQQWNNTKRDYNREETLLSRIEQQVEKTPDQPAVICGEVNLSYKALNQQANQLAHGLIATGIKVGDRVGLCVERSAEMIVALLGIVKSGATYVPLDASYPKDRLHYMVENAELVCVVTHEATQGLLDAAAKPRNLKELSINDQQQERSQDNPGIKIDAEQLLYIIFTSGSTGLPKATGAVHRAKNNLINWYTREFDMGMDDRVMIVSSVGFDLTQKNFFAPLVCGATCVLPRSVHFDYREIVDEIEQLKVTWINCAPSAFYPIVEDVRDNLNCVSSLRWVFLGGEAIQVNRLRHWLNHSETQLVNGYGPTECAAIATYYVLDKDKDLSREEIPIGKPIDNVRLYILNQQQELMPAGSTGEIYIGGESVGPGYLNDAELTQQQFSTDPFNPVENQQKTPGEKRRYATGDLGRYNKQGEVEYLGRRDNQIQLRGYRIELGEIELTISKHSAVTLAVVVLAGKADRLVCYLQLAKDKSGDIAQLQAFLKQRLPDYMIPSQFMILESVPLTPNGKVDRNNLPPMSEAPTADYIEPETETEIALAAIWSELLDHTTEIGREDNFFTKGGNSIVGVQMMSAVEKQFDVTLALAILFQAQTLKTLAAAIEEAKQSPIPVSTGVLVPIQKQGSKTPIFCVHAVGGEVLAYYELSKALGDDQPFYGLQAQGLQAGETPLSDIKVMASHYIEAIKSVQATGPYRLAGHSLGGMIAYEMAQQLLASGEEVARLSLFDTFLPDKTRYQLNDDVDYLQAIFVNPDGSELLPLPKAHLRSLDEPARLRFVFEKAQQVGVVPKGVGFEQTVRLFNVARMNRVAVNAYEVESIGCAVEHFCATRGVFGFGSEEGWVGLVEDLRLYRVDSSHEGILRGGAVLDLIGFMGGE